MDWQSLLQEDEELCWSGRPAPRCFTFRRWIHSVFGLLLAPLCWIWFDGGSALAASRGEMVWQLLPWLGFALTAYFLFGHFLKARMEWERTFYAISSHRVLKVGGWPKRRFEELSRDEVCHVKLVPKGVELGSLQIRSRQLQTPMVLSCLEYPRQVLEPLEETIRKNGFSSGSSGQTDNI